MSLLFISHSSRDNAEALAMQDWLASQGWGEVFLDLDSATGLAPGQRWRDELRKAGERCSAVVVLISPHWAASKWCLAEFLFAAQLGKEVFPVLVAPCALNDLPVELTATYQFADISSAATRAAGLEQLRIGLQRAGLHPGAFRWPPENEPNRPIFRGLRVLEEADAAIFFGRDAHITRALDSIRRLRDGLPERMLVILGASGAGKSSFLRAGLLSRLKRDTERFLVLPTVRPGRAALTGPTGLRYALGANETLNRATIAAHLDKVRAPVLDNLRHHAPASRADGDLSPTVILPIDQAEELFIAGDQEATLAVAGIAETVQADPNLVVLMTIRSDSFDLLQADPLLSPIPRLPFDLPRLQPAAFRQIIEGPTRLSAARITVESDLTEQLVQDFEGVDALPLLAFTLERLVVDHGGDGRIEKREYLDEMKGVGGAIRKSVELAFATAAEIPSLPPSRVVLDALAKRAFVPGLVRIDDATAPAKRRLALRRQLPPEAVPLIDCFVDQRLLVTDTAGNETTVEVSHEAVLRHWRELESWIAERRAELSLSERVAAAARDWQAADARAKDDALVHRGERLRAAEKLLLWDDLRRQMGDGSLAYLAACRDAETRIEVVEGRRLQRQRRLRHWIVRVVAAAAVITSLGAALVVTGQRNLGRAQSLTLARAAEGLAAKGDYVRALRLSILGARTNGLIPASPEGRAALSSSAQGLRLSVEIRGHDGPVSGAVFSKDDARILTWSSDRTARLWNAATGAPIGPPLKHAGEVQGAVFSRDEARILTWSSDGTARLWNAGTGAQIGRTFTHDRGIRGALFSKDETRILTWSSDWTVRLWDAASAEMVGPPLKHDSWVSGAVFSRDETRILSWSESESDRTARLWHATTGKPIGAALRHSGVGAVRGAVFSRDETRILTWGDRTARLWNAETGTPIEPPLTQDDLVGGAVFSKDETRILTWGDSSARLWDAGTGAQIGPALRHDRFISGAAFSDDDARILTWSGDQTARLWSAATGVPIFPPLRHDGLVRRAVFSNDEARILTWSYDGTARLWNAETGAPIGPPLTHDGEVRGAVFSNDQARILTWSDDRTARLWSTATDAAVGPALTHDSLVSGAVFSKDEARILTWSDDRTARLWNAATRVQVGPALTHNSAVRGASFSNDEARILTWSDDRTARLWNAETGSPIGSPLTHDRPVWGAVFSKDETRILTWSEDRTARLWNAATGAQIGPTLTHAGRVRGAVFSKGEARILTWSGDGTARLWNAGTGTAIGPALTHEGPVLGAAFSKDETRILTWSYDRTARLWDVATGAPLTLALTHDDAVQGALFSKDEARILTWGDRTARLWNAATGTQIGAALTHDREVRGAVFSRDESRILTWSYDRTARLWDAATGAPVGPALPDAGTNAVFSKDETRILTWGDSSARLWDAATGAPIGPALSHDRPVWGAVFSKDETRILTWSSDRTARLWDVSWAMRDASEPGFVQEVCREKLVGASFEVRTTSSSPAVLVGVRHIDTRDTLAAPILRGREGEDVCGPAPTTWDTLVSLLGLRRE